MGSVFTKTFKAKTGRSIIFSLYRFALALSLEVIYAH